MSRKKAFFSTDNFWDNLIPFDGKGSFSPNTKNISWDNDLAFKCKPLNTRYHAKIRFIVKYYLPENMPNKFKISDK